MSLAFTSLRALALAAGCLVLSCGTTAAPPDDGVDPGVVIAFASDFNGYKTWPVKVPATSNAPSGVHTGLGPMTAYLNKKPPSGSTSFPVGTIIVKETDNPDPTTGMPKVFAMVKRGGDFNSSGAVDWEWFELKNLDDGTVLLMWRGVGPPAGELYGGNPATCNVCHALQKDADFVWTTALQLSTF